MAAGRGPTIFGTFKCPRHFVSSHPTQCTRPADIGNPHAAHFRKLLNTGGTWLWSASAALPASPAEVGAADQYNCFLGVAVVSAAPDAPADVSTALGAPSFRVLCESVGVRSAGVSPATRSSTKTATTGFPSTGADSSTSDSSRTMSPRTSPSRI